jgi:hypothetical protein
MFPPGCFSEDEDWDQTWSELYAYRLQSARERPIWGTDTGTERYRFLASESFPGILRIEVWRESADLVAKRLTLEEGGTLDSAQFSVQEFRRPLTTRELSQLRTLIEEAELWKLPSRNDRFGLDGYHFLFEAQVRQRYHLVDRWVPRDDGFARLCQFCQSLYSSTAAPVAQWW